MEKIKRLMLKVEMAIIFCLFFITSVNAGVEVVSIKRIPATDGYFNIIEWSPDGSKLLVYNTKGIRMMNADGTGMTKLNLERYQGQEITWSPDGTKFVFGAIHKAVSGAGIYVMNVDGTNKRKITSNTELELAWSLDSQKIAYVDQTPGPNLKTDPYRHHLTIINIDGTGNKILDTAGSISYIIWVTNDTIAYVASIKSLFNHENYLYTIKADGTGKKKVLQYPVQFPNWWVSKDILKKSKIRLDAEGIAEYILNYDGTNLKEFNGYDTIYESWSPDGSRLVGTKGELDKTGGALEKSEIVVINEDGTNKIQLTNTAEIVEDTPRWSPSGDKIAYIDYHTGDLYIMTIRIMP